jgi:hypothetical protein
MSNRLQIPFHAPSCRASSPSNPLGLRHRKPRLSAALGDRPVTGGVEGDDLLDGHRACLLQLQREVVPDEPELVDQASVDPRDLALVQDPGARCQRNPHMRLGGLNLKVDRLLVHLSRAQQIKVLGIQAAVSLHAGVHHSAIDPGADLQLTSPVLCHERRL